MSIVCLAGVVAFGAIPGIGLAIIIAVIEFLWDGWRPHHAVLGRVNGVEGYHDITRYPQAQLIPGLVLFRWDAPLFFANAELFPECLLDRWRPHPRRFVGWSSQRNPLPVSMSLPLICSWRWMRPLCPAVSSCAFAEMKDPVKDKLKRFGLYSPLGEHAFFPTVEGAVSKYVAAHGAS